MNDKYQHIMHSIRDYFRGVRVEWGKITWPEKNQVVVETAFVVIIVFALTAFIYLVDILFDGIFDSIFKSLLH